MLAQPLLQSWAPLATLAATLLAPCRNPCCNPGPLQQLLLQPQAPLPFYVDVDSDVGKNIGDLLRMNLVRIQCVQTPHGRHLSADVPAEVRRTIARVHINLGHPTAEELVRLACHQGNPSTHLFRPFASSSVQLATASNHHRHHHLPLHPPQ